MAKKPPAPKYKANARPIGGAKGTTYVGWNKLKKKIQGRTGYSAERTGKILGAIRKKKYGSKRWKGKAVKS